MLTGEPVPVMKRAGDSLIGATLNTHGSLVMEAQKVGAETMLSQIVQMVARAQRSKAPMQRMADSIAGYFVMGVIAIAILTFVGWGLFGPEPSWVFGLINAVAVLIIACPCALGLATPMSIMVSTGKAASMGVLFRDASAIENLCKIDTLIVDKTGTLTEGRPCFTVWRPHQISIPTMFFNWPPALIRAANIPWLMPSSITPELRTLSSPSLNRLSLVQVSGSVASLMARSPAGQHRVDGSRRCKHQALTKACRVVAP
jgi:Cu+-exporting ATPase